MGTYFEVLSWYFYVVLSEIEFYVKLLKTHIYSRGVNLFKYVILRTGLNVKIKGLQEYFAGQKEIVYFEEENSIIFLQILSISGAD